MRIRTKIILGFFILAAMLAVAGAYSIYELTTISTSVQQLLDDNYRSINASKQMIESLEREDSGLLLLLSGKWKEGRETILAADQNFKQAFTIASHNLTLPGEKQNVERISAFYDQYRRKWDQPIVGTALEDNLNWYFREVHDAFLKAKGAVQELMAANDQAMYQTASQLKDRAHRAVMPGIVAILSALVFTLLFNFFVNLYIVNPLLAITHAVNHFNQTNESIRLNIDTRDELHDLASAVMDMSVLIRTQK